MLMKAKWWQNNLIFAGMDRMPKKLLQDFILQPANCQGFFKINVSLYDDYKCFIYPLQALCKC